MDSQLCDEQTLIRQTAREFCDAEIAPHAAEWDRTETIDRGIVAKLAELGFLAAALPEEHGGMGLDMVSVRPRRRGDRPRRLECPRDRLRVERPLWQVGRPVGERTSRRRA